MKLIIKRFKKKAQQTFKKKKSHHKVNNMSKKHRKSKSKKSGFGSKLKIPIIGKVTNNPTFRKVAIASGSVAIAGALVQLANIPQVNALWNNQVVRSAVAYSTGDITGAIGTYVLENPNLLNLGRSSTQTQISQAGFA